MFKNNNFTYNKEFNRIEPYNQNDIQNNNIKSHNNFDNNKFERPLRNSCDNVYKSYKLNRFQNENMMINKVSPSHFQYKPLYYDDKGYLYENNKYNNNIKVADKDERKINEQINNYNPYQRCSTFQNIDNKYDNIYGFKKTDEKKFHNYLKNPYYKGENNEDGYNHYNIENKNYGGSKFGGFVYNYYLNAPMRSDKTENWRFPPLYYYRPRYKTNNLYISNKF